MTMPTPSPAAATVAHLPITANNNNTNEEEEDETPNTSIVSEIASASHDDSDIHPGAGTSPMSDADDSIASSVPEEAMHPQDTAFNYDDDEFESDSVSPTHHVAPGQPAVVAVPVGGAVLSPESNLDKLLVHEDQRLADDLALVGSLQALTEQALASAIRDAATPRSFFLYFLWY
jgi:hypothetical protein